MKLPQLLVIASLLGGLAHAPALADDAVETQVPPAPAVPEKKPAGPPDKPPATVPEKQPQSPTDKPTPAPAKPLDPAPAPEPAPSDKDQGEQSAKADENKFPTPADIIKRLQQQKAAKAALSKVVHFDLASAVVE